MLKPTEDMDVKATVGDCFCLLLMQKPEIVLFSSKFFLQLSSLPGMLVLGIDNIIFVSGSTYIS